VVQDSPDASVHIEKNVNEDGKSDDAQSDPNGPLPPLETFNSLMDPILESYWEKIQDRAQEYDRWFHLRV
ncbi:hypothetical protein, partial [Serratia marcescens]|uniref:hypothetical protein n=1 Tax=Serratia marcescens TaxID=615 RepID=UPI0028136291